MADIELIQSEWTRWVARQLVAVRVANPREDHAMTMTQEQVGRQTGLRTYIVTYVEFTATADQVRKTAVVRADSVDLTGEYVKLLRTGVGVVFAVHNNRFATLALDEGQPDPPPSVNKGAATKEWWDTPEGLAMKEQFKQKFSKSEPEFPGG